MPRSWKVAQTVLLALATGAAALRMPITLENAPGCPPGDSTVGYLHGNWAYRRSRGVAVISQDDSQLFARCSCRNGVLEANFTWKRDVEFEAFKQYVEVFQSADAGAQLQTGPNNASTWLVSAECWDKERTADFCSASGLNHAFCPEIIWIQNEIVVLNNITRTITGQPANETGTVDLQREIDSFLSSFGDANNYFYGSNLGIGNLANVMLWAAFLMFCLVSIILQWISARRRRAKIALLLLTINSAVMMIGYLTMAFGHGRTTEEQVVFRFEIINAAFMYTGEIVQTPVVPPLFFVRFVMWFFSWPAVLFLTCDFAMCRGSFLPAWVFVSAMVLALLISAQLQDDNQSGVGWFCYAFAALSFGALTVVLIGPVLQHAAAHNRLDGYMRVVLFVLCTWGLYLLSFLLGEKGVQVLSTDAEVIAFVCLDLLLVLGFTILLLTEQRRLVRHGERDAALEAPEAVAAAPSPAPRPHQRPASPGPASSNNSLAKTQSRLAAMRRRVTGKGGGGMSKSHSLSPLSVEVERYESRVDVGRVIQSPKALASPEREESDGALSFTTSPETQTLGHQPSVV
mmetsp:Transcript_55144/g.129049  ORF Transcript_55144/g.129049 Transcript_55144/m.129049 type:complete len:572 (-) Transcript_55144:54-1769(-)